MIARKQEIGRDTRIRTLDTCVPNAVLYQTELHPEKLVRLTGVELNHVTSNPQGLVLYTEIQARIGARGRTRTHIILRVKETPNLSDHTCINHRPLVTRQGYQPMLLFPLARYLALASSQPLAEVAHFGGQPGNQTPILTVQT